MSRIHIALSTSGSQTVAAALVILGATLTGFAISSLEPRHLVLGVALSVAALAAYRYPVQTAAASFALVSISETAAGLSPTEALLLFAAVGWFIRAMVDGSIHVLRSRYCAAVVLLWLTVLVGFLMHPTSAGVLRESARGAIGILLVGLAASCRSQIGVRYFALSLAGSGAVASFAALGQAGWGVELAIREGGAIATGRPTGPFSQPNMLAAYLVLSMALTLYFVMFGTTRSIRFLGSAGLVVILGGLAVTLSRAGYLASVAALLTASLFVPRAGRLLLGVAAAGVVVFAALSLTGASHIRGPQSAPVLSRIKTVEDPGTVGSQRAAIWRRSTLIFAAHPLTGIGAGRFPEYAKTNALLDERSRAPLAHAHNLLITAAVEIGVLGLLAILNVLANVLTTVLAAFRTATGERRGQAASLSAFLMGLCVMSVFHHPLANNVIFGATCITLGLLWSVVHQRNPSTKIPASQCA